MRPLRPDEARPIGRYRPLALLGEGGMGRVFLAVAPDGRLAAVKQIHPGLAHDGGFRARFAHEVDVSRRVSGAYTAAVMDADPDAAAPWLASVYVAGPSLREAVDATGPLPVPSLYRLAVGLATALAEIHRAQLVHRDLKPGNVLLARDGPRVIDFGIARAAEGSELTGTGAIIGSPAFMSPEQASSEPLTPASDMFSLGAVLVMAATGRGPFTGSTAAQTLYNVVHAVPDLSGVPAEIRQLAEPCLAKDPAARPTPAQLLDFLGPLPLDAAPWPPAVQHLIAGQEAEVRAALSWPPPQPPATPSPVRRRRRGLAIGAALGAVGVLAAGTIVALTRGGDEPSAGAQPESPRLAPVEEALSADRLRLVDQCRVLGDEEVPGIGTLEPEPYGFGMHSCHYETEDGDRLQVHVGRSDDHATESGAEIGGLPVLVSTLTGCAASVPLPEAPQLAVSVDDLHPPGDSCERAEAVLTTHVDRLRAGAGLRNLPDRSAIRVDPCSLVDDRTMSGAVGAVQEKTVERLQTCRWSTTGGSVRLSVDYVFPGAYPDPGYEPADLAGVRGYTRLVTEESCVVTWMQREIDDRRGEAVRIHYMGDVPESPCAKTIPLAEASLATLPPA